MAIYDAFISYSHAKDKPVATAVQSIVQRLGKAWYQRRAARIFRDDTSLSATPHLWPSIEHALAQSRFLILFASPEAARSRWVAKEAEYWLSHKGTATLLIVLTAGELMWDDARRDFVWSEATPLPQALQGRFTDEPKWVDLRAYRTTVRPRDRAFMESAAEIAAAVRGVAKEDLLSEELRQQRRALRLAWSAAGVMLLLSAAFFAAALYALNQRDLSLQTLATTVANVNGIVTDVASKVRRTVGIPVETQHEILGRIQTLQKQLLGSWLSSIELRRSEAIVHRELAQTYLLLEEPGSALASAQQSLDVMRTLLAEHSKQSKLWNELRRELSLSYNRSGEARVASGQHQEALEAFAAALAIRQELAQASSSHERKRDLALSHERMGDTFLVLQKPEMARKHYQESWILRDELARGEPASPERQADLAAILDRKGRTERDPAQAVEAYRRSIAIREQLISQNPRDAFWLRDLARTYEFLGETQRALGEQEDAIAALRSGLRIRETLIERSPDSPRGQIELALGLFLLGRAGDQPEERYRRALDLLDTLHKEGKLSDHDENLRQEIEQSLERLDLDK